MSGAARYIFYARGPDAFTDERQRERCLPVLRFLRGPEWPEKQELPPGLVEVLHGGGSDGGIYMPELRGDRDYDSQMAALWTHPSAKTGELDFLILEQDVRPRNYSLLKEIFECDLSPVCGFAYEMHQEYRGAAPSGVKPCTFGGCFPWSGYVNLDGFPLTYPNRWAKQGGLGMLRIKGSLIQSHPRPDWPDGGDWRTLDSRMTPWLTASLGTRIHVHWDEASRTKMVEHRHGKCVGDV